MKEPTRVGVIEEVEEEFERMKEEGDMDRIEESEYERLRKIRKKTILFISLFLFLLMISLSITPYLVGFVGSSKIVDDIVNAGDYKIYFLNNTYDILLKEYTEKEGREIHACLQGYDDGTDFFIETVYFPKIKYADVHRISTIPCGKDTILDLHSHPMRECRMSEQDIKYASSLSWIKLFVIMCSHNRFGVYEV